MLIRGGTLIDGSGAPRRAADLLLQDGRIAAIVEPGSLHHEQVLDADGCIVAPGVIDLHTHYDAQINWDPHCTNSGWHGMTTAVLGNCGFGYAPVRVDQRVRAMQMMVNTEQIPFEAQAAGLPWDWETLPQWLAHLRRVRKAVNVASYVPLNPLLCHVMGVDAAKSRPANADERARLRELVAEALDAGALGIAFSHLGAEGNSHVDFDMTPMPTDTMAQDEAFNLCDVLREQRTGVIQLLSEMPGARDPASARAFVEELARRSQRPVIQNVLVPVPGQPGHHRGALAWLDDCQRRGLDIYMQAFIARGWTEFNVMDMNGWDSVPVFRSMSEASSIEARMALVQSSEYRARLRREYEPMKMWEALGPLEIHVLNAARCSEFDVDNGKTLADIAQARGAAVTDLFLDILIASHMAAEFRVDTPVAQEPEWMAEILRHRRVLVGSSDGGAHGKFHAGGQWSTDVLMHLGLEAGTCSLEEIHAALSARPAAVMGWTGRGSLQVGQAADLMVYEPEALGYRFGQYEVLHDQPGGQWRRTARAQGIRAVIVNGEITLSRGEATGAMSGRLI